MAIAYVKEDQFFLYAMRGELAPICKPRGNKIIYWCITALLALCDEEKDQYPVTRWAFPRDMISAIEKLVSAKEALLEWVSQEEAEARVLAVLDDRSDTLNAAIERQLEIDRQAGML